VQAGARHDEWNQRVAAGVDLDAGVVHPLHGAFLGLSGGIDSALTLAVA
jgi:NH3-dependent NAD+ synthetase